MKGGRFLLHLIIGFLGFISYGEAVTSNTIMGISRPEIETYHTSMETRFKDAFEKYTKFHWVPKNSIERATIHDCELLLFNAIKEYGYIAKGSFGCVFLCEVQEINKKCIMKIFDDEATANDIKCEVEVLELRSKYIPKLYYAGFNLHGNYLIIMEAAFGCNLYYHIKKSNLTFDAIKFITCQLSEALAFLHKNNRIHGDLKPENIGLTVRGNVKLLDFGKSRDVSKPCIISRGTRYYDAPEILKKIEADYSIDWWAYGCVVARLIQNELPFYHKDDMILKSKILNDEPNITITDPDAKDFVLKLLHKDPNLRLKTPWEHRFLSDAGLEPIFKPEDILSSIATRSALQTRTPDELDLLIRKEQKESIISAKLLRYPTRECAKFMNRRVYY